MTFPFAFEDSVHCLVAFSLTLEKPNAIMIPDPLLSIFEIFSVLDFHSYVSWCGTFLKIPGLDILWALSTREIMFFNSMKLYLHSSHDNSFLFAIIF